MIIWLKSIGAVIASFIAVMIVCVGLGHLIAWLADKWSDRFG